MLTAIDLMASGQTAQESLKSPDGRMNMISGFVIVNYNFMFQMCRPRNQRFQGCFERIIHLLQKVPCRKLCLG